MNTTALCFIVFPMKQEAAVFIKFFEIVKSSLTKRQVTQFRQVTLIVKYYIHVIFFLKLNSSYNTYKSHKRNP